MIAKDRPQSYSPAFFAMPREFAGSHLMGGIRDLCLKEVMYLLQSHKIPFSLNQQFIYD